MQAGFDLSLRMMAPRLLMHRGAGTFEELPAHDLALQSNAVIVLDHGTDFFIWTVSSHILYWMMQGSEIVGFVWFWQRDLHSEPFNPSYTSFNLLCQYMYKTFCEETKVSAFAHKAL